MISPSNEEEFLSEQENQNAEHSIQIDEQTNSNHSIQIKKEIFRKSIHLCSALLPFLLSLFYWPIIFLLCLTLVLYIGFESVRLKGKTIPLVSKITEFASRERDKNKFVLGPVTLVLGIVLSAILWRGNALSIGIYALSFGDGLASLGGKLFGKKTLPFTNGKTLAGSLTCFFAVFCTTFLVSKNLIISLVCTFASMIVEVLPLAD
ncbi:MAG: hypothetical protein IJR49_01405, partial [Treponema sp.]|nr:hypothetical protein [Treponema sp.]